MISIRSSHAFSASFYDRTMSVAGPSRSVLAFRHLLPLAGAPFQRAARHPIRCTAASLSTTAYRPQSRRAAYTLAHPISNSGHFEGIPATAYAGNVDTLGSRDKGKGKEMDQSHAAPPPPAPVSPTTEKKRVIKAKKSAITMVSQH